MMQSLGTMIWIMLGGAIGTAGRYLVSGMVARQVGETFPWNTLVVNVVGSFVIGFFATFTGPDSRALVGPNARQFVMIGICGGFTTFSSFSLQTLNLVRDGEWLNAVLNAVISVLACLIGVWIGHVLAATLNRN